MRAPIHSLAFRTLTGEPRSLADYAGKVLLIVNTASACGFTPQYAALEALHRKYAAQGLVVLGFPCNQFGEQEPGDSNEIAQFCLRNYGVSFEMAEKVDVNGESAHPLFVLLKEAAPGVLGSTAIKWNFTKFLVDRHGEVLARYASASSPESLVPDIEHLLAQSVEP